MTMMSPAQPRQPQPPDDLDDQINAWANMPGPAQGLPTADDAGVTETGATQATQATAAPAPEKRQPQRPYAVVQPAAKPAQSAQGGGSPLDVFDAQDIGTGVAGALDAVLSNFAGDGRRFDANYYRNLRQSRIDQQRIEQDRAQEAKDRARMQREREAAAEQKSAESARVRMEREAAAAKEEAAAREKSDPASATNRKFQASVSKIPGVDPEIVESMTLADYEAYGGDIVKAMMEAERRKREQDADLASREKRAAVMAGTQRARAPQRPTSDDFGGLEDL